MKRKKTIAIVAFLLMLLFWIATITHDTLGFVAPNSPEAVGFDLWTTLVWSAFLYSIWNLRRAFTTQGETRVSGSEE
ncbi:MAG: hypothetical protein LAN36_08630 [Acidobacteriia bacterium]|nr:hypothetical protein [Terriglobia bacterium]